MFCSRCGKELPTESKFCNECGARTTPPKNVNDEEIQNELKKYEKHTSRTFLCSECGYEGLMGVSSETIQRGGHLKGVIIFVAILFISFILFTKAPPQGALIISPLFWVGCGAAGLSATFFGKTTKYYRICPNCKGKQK